MKTMSTTIRVLTCVVFILGLSSLAQAQASRTWVSGVGDDVNPCSRTAPCKTFAGAISKTADGGEISVLDPGGYGAVTITKGMTIDGRGTLASILSSLVNGVIVNETSNTKHITLRNISINGIGNGINGIRFLAGKTLTVENVTIQGVTTHGIDVNFAAAPPAGGADLYVFNVDMSRIGLSGIRLTAASLEVVAAIDQLRVARPNIGVQVSNNSFAIIRNSLLAGGATGVEVNGTGSSKATIENSNLTNNTTGLVVASGNTAFLSQNSITQNSTDISGSGSVQSDGSNQIVGNSAVGVVPAIINPK